MTHHSLWFVQWKTTHLMLQAWASMCIFQSSISNYTTWHDLITCDQAHSRDVWFDGQGLYVIAPAAPQASWMPLFAIVGLIMGPPLDLLHCLALYWHGGIDGLDVLHVSTRHRSHSGKQLDNCVPEWLKDAYSTKLFMALQKHSKNFRGIQCKDLKHLIETYDKV